MLDIGWSEMMVVAVLAIIVIGPKELPKALRTLGRLVRKARATAREFQNSIDDMISESELDELRKEAKSLRDLGKDTFGSMNSIDPTGPATSSNDGKTPTAESLSSGPPSETAPEVPAAPSDQSTYAAAAAPPHSLPQAETEEPARPATADAVTAPAATPQEAKA